MNLLVKLEFYFFLKWISQVIKGVRWAMELEKESEREREKGMKRRRKNRKAGGGQQRENDGKNLRQKTTVTQRDITWLFNIISCWVGHPPQWFPWKLCWASNRSIEISQLTTTIPKQNRNFLFCLEVVIFSLQGLLGGCTVRWWSEGSGARFCPGMLNSCGHSGRFWHLCASVSSSVR